jgi:hypothetical protein
MSLCWEFTAASLVQIGHAFGGRSHSTVYACIHRIERAGEEVRPQRKRIIKRLDI